MKSRDIPLEVAHGWGGMHAVRGAPPMAKMMARPMPPMMSNAVPMACAMRCSVMAPQCLVDNGVAPEMAVAFEPPPQAANEALSDSLIT